MSSSVDLTMRLDSHRKHCIHNYFFVSFFINFLNYFLQTLARFRDETQLLICTTIPIYRRHNYESYTWRI
jgi:hypothetical protein